MFIETNELFVINNKQANCNVENLPLKMNFKRKYITGLKKKLYVIIYTFFLIIVIPGELVGQEADFIPSGEISVRLFEDGKYMEAFRHFEALMVKYPADPLYKYYAGACLVESGSNYDKSVVLLKTALDESSSLRKVPVDAWYYRGRANQLAGNFEEAIICYDRFRESVRKKELKAYNIDLLIEQCVSQYSPADKPVFDEITDDSLILDSKTIPDPRAGIISSPETVPVAKRTIEETLHDYDMIVSLALEYQFKADSLSRLANRYRSTVKSLSGQDRETISKKILELESMTFEFQSLADRKLSEAARFNRVFFDGEPEHDIKPVGVAETVNSDTPLISDKPDRLIVPEENTDSLEIVRPVLVLFEDDFRQPEVIPVNDTLPEGLFYRIQTAAFRNPIKPSYFKTLGPVYGLREDGSDITFYNIGYFRKKEDAEKALMKVRSEGYKDAFVIAHMDGERISFERSEVLEKDWARVSLFDPEVVVKGDSPAEPSTLIFRIQVRSSKKKLPEEEVETLRLVAGDRDFDILKNDKDEFVYLIGKFLTFESALNYSDLLYRNGMKDARVAAYMGVKEIPVEKARELFDTNYNK